MSNDDIRSELLEFLRKHKAKPTRVSDEDGATVWTLPDGNLALTVPKDETDMDRQRRAGKRKQMLLWESGRQ